MKNAWSFVLTAVVAAVPASSALAQVVAEESPSPAILSGLELYRQQYCGLCHALDRAETAGIFGPTHNDLVATAATRLVDPDYGGDATTVEEYIRESILKPDVYVVAGYENSVHRMPGYTHLSGEQIDAIVRFLVEASDAGEQDPEIEIEARP